MRARSYDVRVVGLVDDDLEDPGRCPWCRRRLPDARDAAVRHWSADVVLWRYGWARYRWIVVGFAVWQLLVAYAVWPEPLARLWVPVGAAVAALAVCHLPRGVYELVGLLRRRERR